MLNAFNIQVQGVSTGVPTVQGPPVGALTTASNATVATQQAAAPAQGAAGDRPSIIIVEFLGFGGSQGSDEDNQDDKKRRTRDDNQSYNTNSAFQIVGAGALTDDQKQQLTQSEQRKLGGQ